MPCDDADHHQDAEESRRAQQPTNPAPAADGGEFGIVQRNGTKPPADSGADSEGEPKHRHRDRSSRPASLRSRELPNPVTDVVDENRAIGRVVVGAVRVEFH